MARMKLEQIEATLDAAIADQKIWNVDFILIKENLNHLIQATFEGFGPDEVGGHENFWDLLHPLHYSNSTTFLGKIKRINKLPDDNQWPRIKELMRTLQPACEKMAVVKPLVVMGRKPAENPSLNQRTLEHTGTCGCCQRNIKLTATGQIWDHGFMVADRGRGAGYKTGSSCFGVNYEPIEVSPQVWHGMLLVWELRLSRIPGWVTRLEAMHKASPAPSHVIEALQSEQDRAYSKQYRRRAYQIKQLKAELVSLPQAIAKMKISIAQWTPQPLPGPPR